MAAVGAIDSGKAVSQDATLQILAISGLDMKRNVCSQLTGLITADQVCLQVLAHNLMQDGSGGPPGAIGNSEAISRNFGPTARLICL